MDTTNQQASSSLWQRLKGVVVVSLVGHLPNPLGKVMRGVLYRLVLKYLGHSSRIFPGIRLHQAECITIGDSVLVESFVQLDCRGRNSYIQMGNNVFLDQLVRLTTASSSGIKLGDGVRLERCVDIRTCGSGGDIEIAEGTHIGSFSCVAGPGKVTIGKNCLIAAHTGIFANNHTFSDLTRPIKKQGTTSQGIVIEEDCWLGSGVKVLDGVTIGKGSVIGAGAVVTKDIPPYSIAVGVPAKVISKRRQQPSPEELLFSLPTT